MTSEPRPYRDEQDIAKMKAILIEGRQSANGSYYVHVGDLSWWLFYLNREDDRRQNIYLWEGQRADGASGVIGWSLFSPSFRAFDMFVRPEERGGERAEEMFIWTEGRMREIVKEKGGENLRTMWVGEDDAALIALLERRGFARSDYHFRYMTRPLDTPILESQLPPGYCVRHVAGEHEAQARAAASHGAFESEMHAEQHLQGYLKFMRSPAYTPGLDLVVAAPDGRFAAFCICWLDPVNQVGLFEPVGTHPDFQRQGLGKAVMWEGLRQMKARDMTSAMVCVEYDNPAAHRLYESVGFRTVKKIYTYAKDV